MKIIILIILFASTLLSQKLWEIQVNPDDLLRDVKEIPNSDLLLFTYNTGKLEIRRSEDGSFVNQLISKPNESGELRISNSGKVYYWQYYNLNYPLEVDNDTIYIRDIRTNEIKIKKSLIIPELENNEIFDTKMYHRLELFENDSKILCYMIYVDKDDYRNSVNNFIIYNLINDNIEYISQPFSEDYSIIGKSYLSPDDRYFIETAYNKPYGRIFNLETKKYEFEFDGENYEDQRDKIGVLEIGRFQSESIITNSVANIFQIYSFPELNILTDIGVWSRSNFIISSMNGFNICNNTFVCNVAERKENKPTQYYRYFLKYNYETGEIIYNSKNDQVSLEYSAVFTVDKCKKLIIDRDFDYRSGIIACYEYNTLDVENQSVKTNYFLKENNLIKFNSQEFIGQTANIEIYNSTGVNVGILYNGVINKANYNFNIPELPSGAYYIQCQLPNQNLNFNFVVVR